MTSRLVALRIDANDPTRLARFWAGVLGWTTTVDGDAGRALLPTDGAGFRIRFVANPEPKTAPNRMHFDLTSSSPAQQQQTVAAALRFGARHLDVGQRPDEGHVVLADPEGNEFCVIEAGNSFLADCGFVGALACDGSQQVGYFWSEALGWPLVWNQDQETAIRSPDGGPKITWGGEAPQPANGRNRLRFELAPRVRGDQQAEVDRLVALGARRVDVMPDATTVLVDPDGQEFTVSTAR